MAEDIVGTLLQWYSVKAFFIAVLWLERQRTGSCFQMLGDLSVLSVSAMTAGEVLIGVNLLVENTSYV